MHKPCIKCHQLRPLSMFYTHPRMADGTLNKCVDCCKLDARNHRLQKLQDPQWRAQERQRCRLKQERYRQQGLAKETPYAVKNAWRKRNPIKAKAHYMAGKAVKTGKLERKTKCEQCGKETFLHKHHPDYSMPLKVVWLCSPCHRHEHRKDADSFDTIP